jgi:digeranylgeranylglycerophospholipid reductase
MVKSEYDVIIVGSGPGGVSAAYALGKAGISTLLIDKLPHQEIGDKVCGDALNPFIVEQANKMCGLPFPKEETGELASHIDDMVMQGKSKKAKLIVGDTTATVDRHKYGQALLRAAEEFGSVEVLDSTRFIRPIIEKKFLTGVVCQSQGKELSIKSKIVIDASGTTGVVRARLPDEMCTKFPKKLDSKEILVAYRDIIRTKEPHQFNRKLLITYEKELEPVMPGYYWFFSRGEREVNIGLGYFRCLLGFNIRELNNSVRERYFSNEDEVWKSQGDQIPARMPLESLVHNGFMAVGDAGALANPINGEGHGPALISGITAAQIAIKALKIGDVSEKALWEYNRQMWKSYGYEFATGVALIRFVNLFGYDAFDNLIAKGVIKNEDVLMQLSSGDTNKGDILKRVVKILHKPRILLGLSSTFNMIESLKELSLNYPDYENFDEWNTKLQKTLEPYRKSFDKKLKDFQKIKMKYSKTN